MLNQSKAVRYMNLQLIILDNVYFMCPSTDILVHISTYTWPMYMLANISVDIQLICRPRYTTNRRPIFCWQSMVSVSAECRLLYQPRYLPIVGRYVDLDSAYIMVDTSVDTWTNISRSLYQPRVLVEGCAKYTWSIIFTCLLSKNNLMLGFLVSVLLLTVVFITTSSN